LLDVLELLAELRVLREKWLEARITEDCFEGMVAAACGIYARSIWIRILRSKVCVFGGGSRFWVGGVGAIYTVRGVL
jgi:hypothetical protein